MQSELNNHNSIPGCIRKMTNLEQVFFRSPGCTVMLNSRIIGNVSEIELHRALAAVSQIHPLLNAKVVFDDQHAPWFSSDKVPPLPLRVTKRVSDHQWFDELQDENRIPFELEKGPLIRFVLVHSPEVSDFLILCNHSICDGMALTNLVRDIFICYSDPDHERTTLTPPDVLNLLPKKSKFSPFSIITSLFVFTANRKWKKNPHYFSQEDYSALYRAYWEKNRVGAVLLELGPADLPILLDTCRKHDVTLGSAVTAACIAAHEDIAGPFTGNFRQIMVPYDLRRRTTPPIGDVFCLCVGSPRFSFTYDIKKAFWENAVNLHNEIHKRIENLDSVGLDVPNLEPSLIDAFAGFGLFTTQIPEAYTRTESLKRFVQDTGNIVFSMTRNFGKSIAGIIPSNLGKLTIPENYGGLQIDRMVFLPMVSGINPLILGGVSIGGNLVFSMTFAEPMIGKEPSREPDMVRIRNRALEYLGFPEKVHDGMMV